MLRVTTAVILWFWLCLAALPSQAVTYAIDFDGEAIDVVGSITTDGSLGGFPNRVSFRTIVTALNITVSSATQSVTYLRLTPTGLSAGRNLDFAVSATEIDITSSGGGGVNSFTFLRPADADDNPDNLSLFFNPSSGVLSFAGVTEPGTTRLTFTAIPIPASGFLLLSSLAGLGLILRKTSLPAL